LLGAGEVSAAIGRTIAEVGSLLAFEARSFALGTGLPVRVEVAGKLAAVEFVLRLPGSA
jgi:hypothetical protein